MKLESSRLVLGLFLEAIAPCLIISFRFVKIAATTKLLIFNLLFLSITIPLNGTIQKTRHPILRQHHRPILELRSIPLRHRRSHLFWRPMQRFLRNFLPHPKLHMDRILLVPEPRRSSQPKNTQAEVKT